MYDAPGVLTRGISPTIANHPIVVLEMNDMLPDTVLEQTRMSFPSLPLTLSRPMMESHEIYIATGISKQQQGMRAGTIDNAYQHRAAFDVPV
jgi:hypothetical protein